MKNAARSLAPLLLAPVVSFAQTTNPYPNPIPRSTFTVNVSAFADIPNSGSNQPARVNQLAAAPNGTIFAMDQRGPMYSITGNGQTVTKFFDLNDYGVSLISSSEQGFQSFAFHPDYNTSGRPGFGKFYTAFSTGNTTPTPDFTAPGSDSHDEVIYEWTTSNPLAATFTPANPAAPFRQVIRMEHPFGNHNTGLLAFNPNATAGSADYGKLYIAVGDGGSGGDPLDLAQNRADPYGSILRIDPLGTDAANGRYGIPLDNPFRPAGADNADSTGETYAFGLRNPQRFSWDRGGNQTMFIADIGQNAVEEINAGVSGANYGWRRREGSFVYNTSDSTVGANSRGDAATTGFTYPIAEYDHSEGSAVTAGFVVRRGIVPQLEGKFLFSDFPSGRVFFIDADTLPNGGQSPLTELRLRLNGVEMTFLQMVNQERATQGLGAVGRTDLRFGTDQGGNIYLFNKHDGTIRLLEVVPEPSSAMLFATAGLWLMRRRRVAR